MYLTLTLASRCGATAAHTGRLAVELVLLNKHQISGGGAYLDCYPITNLARVSFCASVAGVVFLYIDPHQVSAASIPHITFRIPHFHLLLTPPKREIIHCDCFRYYWGWEYVAFRKRWSPASQFNPRQNPGAQFTKNLKISPCSF